MRFYVLSDLHLDENTDMQLLQEILRELCERIRANTPRQEAILFIGLGDVTNAGNPIGFAYATELFQLIKEELKGRNVLFDFVPGNHDRMNGDITPFDDFAGNFGVKHKYAESGVYSKIYEDVNFIFADSLRHGVHNKAGQLDLEAIKSAIKIGKMNILFCHHTITQGGGGDHDTVCDNARVLRELEAASLDFVFHGHTHVAHSGNTKRGIIEIGCGKFYGQEEWMKKDSIANQFSVGYINGGRIAEVYRHTVSRDGGNTFPHSRLYPEEETFKDPSTVRKVKYESCEYIPRKVCEHALALSGAFARGFYPERCVLLKESLQEKRKILLLSGAGMGKSVELKNFAHELYCEHEVFPYWCSLRDYESEEIDALLPKEYAGLHSSYLVLLFDGYDELKNDERISFEKALNKYLERNSQTLVVVSSRSNFCRIESGNESKTFPGFYVVDLLELEKPEIEQYLNQRDIDPNSFFNAATVSDVYQLINNPFYLTLLCELFEKYKKLPPKADLMETLIKESFHIDDLKSHERLEDRAYELNGLLDKLAFAMQLMQANSLDDASEYQSLIEDFNSRELLKKSGLFKREGKGWQFVHNNFREYLAARYLSKLNAGEVKAYIADKNEVRAGWVNTLSYLAGMELEWDIVDWLAAFAPSALVKCDPDRVLEERRNEIFVSIFKHHEEEGLWYDNSLCTERDLAHFAESDEALTFLLDRINNPVNPRAQCTAIKILRCFNPTLYGRGREVCETLVSCCEAFPNVTETVCKEAILAIAQLNLGSEAVTDHLLALFSECDKDVVRLGMYRYLVATKQQDRCVQFFIDGLSYLDKSVGGSRILDELCELESGFESMRQVDSVVAAMEALCSDLEDHFYGEKRVFAALKNTAVTLYKEGEISLFDEMCRFLDISLRKYCGDDARSCIEFFKETGTEKQAVNTILERFLGDEDYLWTFFSGFPEAVEILIEEYASGAYDNHAQFCNIISHHTDDEQYARCTKVVEERTGKKLRAREPRKNYSELRKQGEQAYFNVLFSEEKAKKLFEEILVAIGTSDIAIEELNKRLPLLEDLHSPQQLLKNAIYVYCQDRWPQMRVSAFFETVDFNRFSWERAAMMLHSRANTEIAVSEEQKQNLCSRAVSFFGAGIIDKELICSSESIQMSELVRLLVWFAQKVDLDLPQSVLLKMTEIPAFIFREDSGEKKYQYLCRKLPKETLSAKIKADLQSVSINMFTLEDHLEFCERIQDAAATDKALDICKSTDYSHSLKRTALHYLYTLFGPGYISRNVMPSADKALLIDIYDVCKDISRDALRSAMEKIFAEEKDTAMLEILIQLDSDMAVEYYVQEAERLHHPPDLGDGYVSEPTRALRELSDPRHLPVLGRLLDVLFLPDFIDNNIFSLYSSLQQAIVKCADEDNDQAIALVEKHAGKDLGERSFFFCASALKDIERQERKKANRPFSLKEAKREVFGSN